MAMKFKFQLYNMTKQHHNYIMRDYRQNTKHPNSIELYWNNKILVLGLARISLVI